MIPMLFKRLAMPALALLLAFSILSCDAATTTSGLSYEDFDHIDDYDEIFDRRQETYLVYIYSLSCSNCASFKEEILAFASTYTDHVLFFFCADDGTSDLEADYLATIGATSLLTPTLLLILDNDFDRNTASRYYFTGSTRIRTVLNDIESDSYQYWP
jgi:hypothetical protein